MNWHIKPFAQLSNNELWQIYKSRVDVFVVEQKCAYPEVDEADLDALHLFAESGGKLSAYCRIVPKAQTVKIGRVLVAQHARGGGLARALMRRALHEAAARFPNRAVGVQAQLYLRRFYESLGFQAVSDEYPEDGILHIDMVLNAV